MKPEANDNGPQNDDKIVQTSSSQDQGSTLYIRTNISGEDEPNIVNCINETTPFDSSQQSSQSQAHLAHDTSQGSGVGHAQTPDYINVRLNDDQAQINGGSHEFKIQLRNIEPIADCVPCAPGCTEQPRVVVVPSASIAEAKIHGDIDNNYPAV